MDRRRFLISLTPVLALNCHRAGTGPELHQEAGPPASDTSSSDIESAPDQGAQVLPDHIRLAKAAEARTRLHVTYDPAYVALDYPMGDVPDDRGVCTDLVIRAYRAIGHDLQMLVHEDMTPNFAAYPDIWGLSRPDPNIDHRRVPNLETFFTRNGARVEIVAETDLQPGDLVTWRLDDRLPHIGIVTTQSDRLGRPLIAHNIGRGPELEACFDSWSRTGVFRYRPWDS